jgi:hypothetical protein
VVPVRDREKEKGKILPILQWNSKRMPCRFRNF